MIGAYNFAWEVNQFIISVSSRHYLGSPNNAPDHIILTSIMVLLKLTYSIVVMYRGLLIILSTMYRNPICLAYLRAWGTQWTTRVVIQGTAGDVQLFV